MSSLLSQLQTAFPKLEFQPEVPLAPMTQVKLGGQAEVFLNVTERRVLEELAQYCHKNNVPLVILGWGANTLISDLGLRGLVIRNSTREVEVSSDTPDSPFQAFNIQDNQPAPRFEQVTQTTNTLINISQDPPAFKDLEYDESNCHRQTLLVDSGAPLPWLISHSLQVGLTGLQWYSRIPATLGGAVVNNIHGGSHFLSEVILGVDVVSTDGKLEYWPTQQLDFGYDYSVFHKIPAVIIRLHLSLFQGDVDRAKSVVQHWATAKRHQPQRSLGCIFQNIAAEEQRRLNLPTSSAGYFIDQVLHLKGYQIGGARISQKHAAFIETDPKATSADYLAVINHICYTARQHGAQLKPEIFFRGFTKAELSGIMSNSNSKT